MKCKTCKYISDSFCAVNPTHCKGRSTEACKEYEEKTEKEIEVICGNCIGMHMGTCELTHANVEASDKGCWDFLSHDELDEMREGEEEYEYYKMLPNIKIELLFLNGNLKKFTFIK